MAFRKRRSFRRGNFVSRQEHMWTAIYSSGSSVVAATTLSLPVVSPTDWVVRSGSTHATLVRVRGQFSFHPTSAANARFAALLVVNDIDEALPNPDAVAAYVEEDVLGAWSGIAGFVAAGDITPFNFVIDVKARRKLRNEDQVTLLVRSPNTGTIAGHARALIVTK